MSEHTPGPWSLRPPTPTTAYIDTPNGGFGVQCSGIPGRAEWEANARLIAAAPDLLAALKKMLAPDAEGDVYDALTAIAKAEGQDLSDIGPRCLCEYAIVQEPGKPLVHDQRCPKAEGRAP